MPTTTQAYSRDANRIPITRNGLLVSKAVSFTADGAATAIPIFDVTGLVEIIALYGIVTTAIGSNHTAAHWRLNDHTATNVVISAASGTTISGLPAGTLLARIGLVATALSVVTSAAANILDPVAATAPDLFMPVAVIQKTAGVVTHIEYVYSTNNTSLGAMTFYCGFIPLSEDGNITAS